MQAAYWRGIVISLIDIYYPEYPQLLGFQCGTPSDTFYKDNFWITYYISIKAIDPGDIEKVIETVKSCNKIDKISELSNMVNVAKGVGKESFDVENGYMIFTSSLTAKLLSATSVNQPVEIPLNEENK